MATSMKTSFTPEELTQAFEILLGEPLTNFDTDSTYAAFFCETSETALLSVLTPENLVGAPLSDEAQRGLDAMSKEIGANPGCMYDLARSLFFFSDDEDFPFDFGIFKAVSLTREKFGAILTGRAVAGLAPAGVNLASSDRNDLWLSETAFRMTSDGTLHNTMAVATGTHGEIVPRTFKSLKNNDDEDDEDDCDDEYLTGPDEEWVKALSKINNPTLREHLGTFCLNYEDARCAFWRFAGSRKNFRKIGGKLSKFWAEIWAKELGWKQIAKWEITDGPPASLVIVRIPPGKELA